MIAHPGLRFIDHTVTVPLDHRRPDGPTIEVFAREVVADDRATDDLPWLLFLQGGPGGKGPRPLRAEGWIGHAVRTHRVLLLDQRGTGRSTPVTARTVRGMPDAELAAYLKHFRADSIVADAEILRAKLTGGAPWDTLGQSYGGFITLHYLCVAPQALRTCYVTGGLPGLDLLADDVYAITYPLVAARNAEFYQAFPDDAALVRRIADHLTEHDVRLPDGDRLTVNRLRLLGTMFGGSTGYAQLHWMLDEAWHGDELSDTFRHEVLRVTGFVDVPLFALQEYTYGRGAPATSWAADRAIKNYPEFAADADPLLFTGEMMYPWMFQEIAALRPFAGAADILAATDDWPSLYDTARLAANQVPIFAAVYADDMYVPAELSLRAAPTIGNLHIWVTADYEHDGLRVAGETILDHLMGMAASGRAR
ncbi:alpha/beta hydrolase [Actinoplanes ianthinogenes]|uniref:Alpha/beta hydrolase n=1 Tax=Actinoplanes ianthinogenes TaxID=122358 RepID=A0ABM7M4Y0_9ACTN|nr:alpha/beta fold hydrolase [Actinoplanes ianthinogenes]BCJ46689.1 alpha/beta hydrolase [Actinoplanes ianthinogenes]GGR16333.1 alpha/beta hydrolase [Actinoplanes ianthinogenes]